jgi:hypothetical protein
MVVTVIKRDYVPLVIIQDYIARNTNLAVGGNCQHLLASTKQISIAGLTPIVVYLE